MKKITLLLALLISSIGFSQVIVTPVYEGTFDGTTYLQTFNFPTGAQSWAGFANNNVSIYPLSYPNGGQISFKATVATNAEIKFVFEKDLYPNVTPSVSSVNVALLATNPANTVYTVAIPANATNTYKSALMYVVTRDVAVSLSEIKLIKFDTDGTTQLKVDFPIYDGTFDGTTYSQTFNFPTGAQNWAGFANNNTTIYPLSFTNGGKVSFKATVATNAEIKFVFEKDLYPNVTPSVSTANVALLATNPANTLYEVAIPANTTNTYKSALMYVITRDVEVSLSEIKIHTNAATPPPTATYELPFDFEDGLNPFTANQSVPTVITDPDDANKKVLQIVGKAGQYDNIVCALDKNIDLSDDSNNTITFRIKPVNGTGSGNHLLKFEGNGATELAFTTTGTDWQNISINFGSGLSNYPKIVLFTDFNNNSTDTYLFDDLAGGTNVQPPSDPQPPSAAAPTPPSRNSWDVISLYSDAYTQTSITNFDAGWCGTSSVKEIQIAGNNTLLWGDNPCQGIEINTIDASTFTHMHLDLYILDGTDVDSKVFNLKFVETADNSFLEVDFNKATNPPLEAGKWISIDVPVNLAQFDKLNQFAVTSGNLNKLAWYDNLYFYRAATASVEDNLFNVSLYPNPASNRLNISAANTIQNAEIYNVLGKKVMNVIINKTSESIDISNLASGVYMIKYNIENSIGTAKFIKQ